MSQTYPPRLRQAMCRGIADSLTNLTRRASGLVTLPVQGLKINRKCGSLNVHSSSHLRSPQLDLSLPSPRIQRTSGVYPTGWGEPATLHPEFDHMSEEELLHEAENDSVPGTPIPHIEQVSSSDSDELISDRASRRDVDEVLGDGADEPPVPAARRQGPYIPKPRKSSRPCTNDETDRALRVLHEDMGHPSPREMQRLLRSAGGSDAAANRAGLLQCDICLRHQLPEQTVPSTQHQAKNFNDRVGVDLFTARDSAGKQFFALNAVCFATRYQTLTPTKSKRPKHVLKALNPKYSITYSKSNYNFQI